MRHRSTKVTLDRKSAARRALLSGLAQSVILYERVQTTRGKAKAVRPYLERLIEYGKEGTLAGRRKLLAELPDELAVKKTIEVLGPRYMQRTGGYVRLTNLPPRKGDGAEVMQIELL
ncbi:50S ribosomal protein L17 [Candidatus Uhrbacteria bacterium]|nr:50S ribosomal protein L17 [Candidatus Uhrbacteria bacterium]